MTKNLHQKLQVFLADDSALMCQHLVTMFAERGGIDVVGQAKEAPAAASLICDLKPDVVALDINIIGGSGFDVLHHIRRELPQFQQSPVVIMLSNHSHEFYRRKAVTAGANFFFDKSTEFEKMRNLMANLACHSPPIRNHFRGDAFRP